MYYNYIIDEKYEIHVERDYCVIKKVGYPCYIRCKGRLFRSINDCLTATDKSSVNKIYDILERLFERKPGEKNEKKGVLAIPIKLRSGRKCESIRPIFTNPVLFFSTIILGFCIALKVYCDNTADSIMIKPWMSILWTIINIVSHEMGHILFCCLSGRAVKSIGVKIHYGFPMFFIDTSDVCMASKYYRILTSLGGLQANSILCIIAGVAYYKTLKETCIIFVYISIAFVISNVLPFLKFDGYYALQDILGVTNIATLSKQSIYKLVSNKDKVSKEDLPYIVYGILSIIVYCTIVFCAINTIAIRLQK